MSQRMISRKDIFAQTLRIRFGWGENLPIDHPAETADGIVRGSQFMHHLDQTSLEHQSILFI